MAHANDGLTILSIRRANVGSMAVVTNGTISLVTKCALRGAMVGNLTIAVRSSSENDDADGVARKQLWMLEVGARFNASSRAASAVPTASCQILRELDRELSLES
jgi:hypothetical protein